MSDYSRYKYLLVEAKEGVATITLNRPEVLNAVNLEMHRELEDLFLEMTVDPEVKAIILTGAGRAFCAGGDVKGQDARANSSADPQRDFWRARRLVQNIVELRQPIIGAINGDAVGMGATLALFCDIIIAADKARFGDTHVKVGLVAGDGGSVIWPILIGPARAKELLMTGDLVTAQDAERMGLVNRVVPAAELLPTARALAERFAKGPTLAIQGTKLAINKMIKFQINLVLDASMGVEAMSLVTEDHKEAARAFLEKRAPRFKGT